MNDKPPARTPPARGDDPLDPRGLIREAYRIEGVTIEDCRAIFFDWALGRSEAEGSPEAVAALLARHGPGNEDHPMTAILRAGLEEARAPVRRRGGRRARACAPEGGRKKG
ncbi:hypothetical protein [Oceanicella actignis]|uniref:hypothetical protein n=1 Tax=Oceanicella actignis TaxID=1189325 RepID=UPI0011E74E4D|nr:hypothetical protein [Oceanicella actignis]TYO90089.1 hypothetical protein LY05_01289 [Oceanicella actignis]